MSLDMHYLQTQYSSDLVPDIAVAFFTQFARFEYAMKAAGFFRHPVKHEWETLKSKVHWDTLANDPAIKAALERPQSDALKSAIAYFAEYPPHNQLIKAPGVVVFEPREAVQKISSNELLIRVRCIRNSLFHGGADNPERYQADRDRLTRLMEEGLVILDACLQAHEGLRSAYIKALEGESF